MVQAGGCGDALQNFLQLIFRHGKEGAD